MPGLRSPLVGQNMCSKPPELIQHSRRATSSALMYRLKISVSKTPKRATPASACMEIPEAHLCPAIVRLSKR
ncbi:uncharacterized [Tachysurus ichikawai]